MDEATVRGWLASVTYRPGWAVRCAGSAERGVYVTVHATEPDVRDPGAEFATSPLFLVPLELSREAFYDWLLDVCIPGVEQHERYEWFRIDGKHHRDPHADGMPAFATSFETP